jgi:hypothetical protein
MVIHRAIFFTGVTGYTVVEHKGVLAAGYLQDFSPGCFPVNVHVLTSGETSLC